MKRIRHRSRSERWPNGGPRFTYGSVTGWPITPESLHSIGRLRPDPSTFAYVYDAAFSYRIVASFPNWVRYGPRGKQRTPLQQARRLARQLNREDREQSQP